MVHLDLVVCAHSLSQSFPNDSDYKASPVLMHASGCFTGLRTSR